MSATFGTKNDANFVFLAPFVLGALRGHFEEIGIVKVLLKTKPSRVGKFRDIGFQTSEKVWREKKEKKINSGKIIIMVASLSLC